MERTWNELGGGIGTKNWELGTGNWEMGNGKWEMGKGKKEMGNGKPGTRGIQKSGVWSCGFRPPAAAWPFFSL